MSSSLEDSVMASTISRFNFYTINFNSFISSPYNFRILRTISPRTISPPTPPTPTNLTSRGLDSLDGYFSSKSYYPSTDALKDYGSITQSSPQTLYILDSSFNPPTLAHAHICLSALRDHYASPDLRHTKARLLLLLSTQNADKKITGARLEERLVGIECFATDLLTSWIYRHSAYYYRNKKNPATSAGSESTSESDTENESGNEDLHSSGVESEHESNSKSTIPPPSNPSHSDSPSASPEIDIALTSLPYFHDKSAAIEKSAIYPPGTTHIHCTGYDTLIRVLNPKYYPPTHDLSPLIPFLERHKLRVTYRTSDDGSHTKEDQDTYLSTMTSELPKLGGLSDWITEKRIYMAEGLEGDEISSTKVRDVIRSYSLPSPHTKGPGSSKRKGKGKTPEKLIKERLKGLVGEGVRKWILGEKLYFHERKNRT
ncbi:hypothetical protein MFRU_026g00040 [Monilinia fructicola]|nr:hypothetical protein MFRU_026g00040 [Monilinia fructicola]